MPNDFHRSTQRAIDIMSLVAKHNTEGLTMTELSLLLNAPKSSLFSIIHTLEKRIKLIGLLEKKSFYQQQIRSLTSVS